MRFDRPTAVWALKALGPAPYRVSVRTAAGSAGLPTIDLSTESAGWHAFPSDSLVTTNELILSFAPTGTGGAIPELELWEAADASPGVADIAATELVDGLIAFAADSKHEAIAPGNCVPFEVNVGRSPALLRRAHLVYETTGVFRSFSLARTINGLAMYGSDHWIAGDATARVTSEQIDPSVLLAGTNQVRLCSPATATNDVSIANLRIVGELDRGVGLGVGASVGEDARDASALVDGDTSTSVEIGAGERVTIALDRLVAPDAVVLAKGDVASAACRTKLGTTSALSLKQRAMGSGSIVLLDGAALACAERDLTFAAPVTLDELDVVGSGAAERVDVPRVVAISPREHFGSLAWVGGFVTRPTGMPGAIRVEMASRDASAFTGDFGAVLTREGDADTAWPVAIQARLPDGMTRTQQLVLGTNHQAQLAAAKTQAQTSAAKLPAERFGAEGDAVSVRAATGAKTAIRLGTHVGVDVPPGALKKPTSITVRHLGVDVLPPLEPGMINVTAPKDRGYEFLPHGQTFARAVEVVVPYEPSLIPEGMAPDDVNTYFFDPPAKRWKRLDRVAVDVGERVVRSASSHFTIMINAVLAVPKNPTPLSFDPTMLTSLGAASPAANITLIEPPTPNPSGDARVAYPLWIPAARGAYSPALQIAYSSAAGSSWLGLGWDLQLSRIEIDSRWGVPRYDREPRYLLDGAQLVPTNDDDGPSCTAGQASARYHTRIEGGFAHILRCGDSPSTYTWEVHDRAGTLFVYGTPTQLGDSALRSPDATGNIFRWHLASVLDVHDNETHFEYQADSDPSATEPWTELYPLRITYTKRKRLPGKYKVEFVLDNGERRDEMRSGRAGFQVVTRRLLRAVQVFFDDQPVRTYVLTYKRGQFDKTLLSKITVFGAGACSPSSVATHAPVCSAQRFDEHALGYHDETDLEGFSATEVWDVQGDPDPEDGTLAKGRTLAASLRGGLSLGPANAGVSGGIGDRNELIGTYDIDGDGRPDMVFQDGSDVVVLYNQSGSATDPSTHPLFSASGPALNGLAELGDEDHYNIGADASLTVGPDGVGAAYSSSVSRASRLFADLDGDGYTDQLVGDGDSLFGGPCAQGQCFSSADKKYGAVKSIDPREDKTLQDTAAEYKDRITTGAPVTRWVAQYTGTIEVTATAKRVRAGGSGDVSVDLWHKDTKLADTVLGPTSTTAVKFANATPIDVVAGEAIYLRVVGGDEDVAPDGTLLEEVDARLHVEYRSTCFAGDCRPTLGLRTTAIEPTGEPVFVFDSHDDFRVAGKPIPIWMPIEGSIDVHGLIDKHLTAAPVRICLQIYEPDTLLAAMDVPCNITKGKVRYVAPLFLAADDDVVVAYGATGIQVKTGEWLVLRVEADPRGLTIDPADIAFVPSRVGLAKVAYTSVCMPQPNGAPCANDHRADTLAQFALDDSELGAFVVLPQLPELNLPGQERQAPVPFVAPRAGSLTLSGIPTDGDLVIRSDLRGFIRRQRACAQGWEYCDPEDSKLDVLPGESVTFELLDDTGIAYEYRALFAQYSNDPTLIPVAIVDREEIHYTIATPFVGGYRGFEYTIWNEAIPFEPTRLLEDYRVWDKPDAARRAEMAKSTSLLVPKFESARGPHWYARGSLAFIDDDSQNGGQLAILATPGSGNHRGLFASGYARLSTSTALTFSASGLAPRFGFSGSLSVTKSRGNTTTDVVDLDGDGIADVLASKKTYFGTLVDGDGGYVEDETLGDGFRPRGL